MNIVRITSLALLGVAALFSSSSFSEPILTTQTSWDGGSIQYPEGQPKVTSHRLIITQQTDMPFHCHPVPTLGHILKGQLYVETLAGKSTLLKAGDSVVEVMNTIHRGKAIGGDVELVVFYAGASHLPDTVLKDSPLSEQYCSP